VSEPTRPTPPTQPTPTPTSTPQSEPHLQAGRTTYDVPALVTLHLWGVPTRAVPAAFARMGLDRRPVRTTPGLRFAKLLGTGDGRTFTLRDADPRHWGLLATWDSPAAADDFEGSRTVRAWDRLAEERLRVVMRPLSSRGTWAGQHPFGDPTAEQQNERYDGPVAAITRARIDPRKALVFWRSVPPVSADLHRSPGLRLAVGVGEAPVGLQGTFSLWTSGAALTDFAHRRAPHVEAIRATAELGWYTEELFARLAVLDVDGTFAGRAPLAAGDHA
jgi:hypothetical protein